MKNYIFIILLALSMTSCIKAKCPGYDLNDFRDISFRGGDTLTYISSQSDTICLIVNDFYSRGAYEFSSYPDYECDFDTYYQTDIKENISIKEHITYGISVQFCNDKEYKITSGNYTQKDNYEMYVSDTVINDISYKKYFVKDLLSNRRINKFIKLDFCGITEFYDKATGLTWKQSCILDR
jgi:predicted nucleic-acid-binding Zn-ribbon protein